MPYDTSISSAAKQLGITVQATHKRIKNGSLRARKINNHWLVDSESIAESLMNKPKAGRPRKGIAYTLMNGNHAVMEFSFDEQNESFLPREVFDAARAPIGTVKRTGAGSADGLKRWWSHRSIPGARNGLDTKLAELGLASASLIPFRNLGFSLSDQYWVQPSKENLKWEDLNYFQNDFGNGADSKWHEWLSEVGLSSPDNTSEGLLPKKWACRNGRRILLKGHISWTDQQVYNEVVATALHRRLLENAEFVPYEAEHIESLGSVSTCECFIAPHEEYVPASLIFETEGKRKNETVYDALMRQSENLGIAHETASLALSKMIVCDSIIANTDRHLRNFGFIRDIETLEWRFAPLFDSGNSLWYDKTDSDVTRGDYSFASRPFALSPNKQLMLAAGDAWLDMNLLDGFDDEAAAILESSDIDARRLAYIAEGIKQRINALAVIMS